LVLARDATEPEAREVIQDVSLAVYEALTGDTVDPGWSRYKQAAPIESGVVNPPAPPPSPPENTKTPAQGTEPTKPPPDEKSAPTSRYDNPPKDAQKPEESAKPAQPPYDKKSWSGDWYNVTPPKPKAPLDQYAWQYADPKAFAPSFDEETTYWEYAEY